VDDYHLVNDTGLVPVAVEPMLPLVPTVLSVLTLGSNATVATAYGPTSFILPHLSAVQITLKNGDSNTHPFHIHGHKIQIVNRADDYTSDDPTLNPPVMEGQANPMRRDTVQVPSGASVSLRTMADNPGAWLFHCHIEWHFEAGLAVTLIEAPLEMQQRAQTAQSPPTALEQQCLALNLPVSGNAAGHASTTDLSGLQLGPFPQNDGWHTKGILALTGCVLTAVIGMITVVWYAMGGALNDEEIEQEVRAAQAAKMKRGRLFGLLKRKQQ